MFYLCYKRSLQTSFMCKLNTKNKIPESPVQVCVCLSAIKALNYPSLPIAGCILEHHCFQKVFSTNDIVRKWYLRWDAFSQTDKTHKKIFQHQPLHSKTETFIWGDRRRNWTEGRTLRTEGIQECNNRSVCHSAAKQTHKKQLLLQKCSPISNPIVFSCDTLFSFFLYLRSSPASFRVYISNTERHLGENWRSYR